MGHVADNTPAKLHADVIVEVSAWDAAEIDASVVARAVDALWARIAREPGDTEMSVLLTGDNRLRELNAQFRQTDKPTNVLSFPSGDDEYIGDIALGAETVSREATELDVTVRDHVMHLIIHGTLHLLGYDHETSEDAEEMESLEVLVLKDLGIANPYEGRELSHTVSQSETIEGAT